MFSVHTANANATQLDNCVTSASAVCTGHKEVLFGGLDNDQDIEYRKNMNFGGRHVISMATLCCESITKKKAF